jgi:hypothetical protein
MEKFTFFSNLKRSKEDLLKYSFEICNQINLGNPQIIVDNSSFKMKVHLQIVYGNITTFEQVDKVINTIIIPITDLDDYYLNCADWESDLISNLDEQAKEVEDQSYELNLRMTTYTIESSQTNEKIYVTIPNTDILNKKREEIAAHIANTIVNNDL